MGLVKKFCFKNKAKDVSKEGIGADLQIGHKFIEVKGVAEKNPVDFRIYKTAIKLINSKKDKYYVYVVYNIWREPKLLKLNKRIIRKNLKKSKQKDCYQILGIRNLIQSEKLKSSYLRKFN